MNMGVLRVLEEHGRRKAESLTTYGLDSEKEAKLSNKIANRLKRMRFKIPTTLEIRDERNIEENIYLIDSSDRTYVARLRGRRVILETVNGVY